MENKQSEFSFTRFAKYRALALLEQNDLIGAIRSIVSDLGDDPRRPEIQRGWIIIQGMALQNNPNLDGNMVRKFIEGFPEPAPPLSL